MRNSLVVTGLILIPVFLLIVDDFSWESLSIGYIKKFSDQTDARSKLTELGYTDEKSYENYRYRQLILIFLSLSLELVLSILLNLSLSTLVLCAAFTAAAILVFTERQLAQEIKKYRESIESDFPIIVEALTLSLSAGESPMASMQRIATRGSGSLVLEFNRVIASVTDGIPFSTALDAMGRRMSSVAVRRFVDAIVIAITRGAPLIEVLHSHSQESRDYQRNRVLSAASKAELSMMVPVVFLILPISILFALWPSLSNLNLFAQG